MTGAGRLRRVVLGLALATLVAGCGAVRFQRAWSGFERSASASDVEGRWRGEWRSAWNGHSGGLRCLVTPAEPAAATGSTQAPERVRAWFYSTYARILFFQYRTELAVAREADGRVRFAGEQDLGRAAGGLYRYEGVITLDRFHAHYRAENGDHGVFEMRRAD